MNVLKRIFTHNLTTKIMALFMAVALWTYAYFFSLQQEESSIPVVITAPQGWEVIHQNPRMVTVILEYPKYSTQEVRAQLAKSEIVAEYKVSSEPLSPIQPFADIPITRGSFHLPPGTGAVIRSWKQEKVSFTLAKQETRELPVKLDMSELPPGYALAEEPWYNPRTVPVRGPAEALAKAGAVYTDEIKVVPPPRNAPAPRAVIGIRPYVVVDRDGRNQQFDIVCNEKIEYIIYLTPVSRERVFDKVKIMIVEPPGYRHEVKLKQTEMRVTVRGPDKEVEALRPEDILLFVNVGNLEPGPTPYPQAVNYEIRGAANPFQLKVGLEQPTVGVDVQPSQP